MITREELQPTARKAMTPRRRYLCLVAYDWRCAEPACALDLRSNHYQIDHILPLELGGADDDGNLQPLCVDCHKLKTLDDVRRIRKAARIRRKLAGEVPAKQKIKGRGFQRDPLSWRLSGRATPEDAAEDGSREAQRSGGTTPIQTPSPTQKERER